MEEDAILANIASIIAKDMLIDENNSFKFLKPKHFLYTTSEQCNSSGPFTLRKDDNDEEFTYFMRLQRLRDKQQQQQRRVRTNKAETHAPKPAAGAAATTSAKRSAADTAIPKDVKRRLVSQKGKELNLLNDFQPAEFESFLHMSKMTFLKIFQSMRHLLLRPEFPISMPPQTAFSLSVWKLATDEHFEQIARKFQIPLNDCQQIIRHFWTLISNNCGTFIKWPNTAESQKITLTNFQAHSKLKCFRNLFGIVAITHLDIFLEHEDVEIPIIVQIICDGDHKIIDCYVDLAHSYSFDATPIGKKLAINSQTIPANSFLIGNDNFPLKRYLMRPFDITPADEGQQYKYIAFNQMLQPAIDMAQYVLDSMAKRFNTLYALEAKDLTEVRKIIETVCALHNLCNEVEDDYVERKQGEQNFSWAKAVSNLNIKVSVEKDEQGELKRIQLVNDLGPLN